MLWKRLSTVIVHTGRLSQPGRPTVVSLHRRIRRSSTMTRPRWRFNTPAHTRRHKERAVADFGAHPIEGNGDDGHIHVLIEYPPTVQLSKLIN